MCLDFLHVQVFSVQSLVSRVSHDHWWCHHCITGVGSQFLVLAFGIIIMAMLGLFNVHRWQTPPTVYPTMLHTWFCTGIMQWTRQPFLLYALTSCVAGYVSGSFYKKLGGTAWTWNIILTASLFAMPFFVVWSIVNTVAWINLSTQALPFTTIILIFILWLIGEYDNMADHWLLW